MDLIVFSKSFKEKSVKELIGIAHENGFEGYDMCVREGYPISPENVGRKLGEALSDFKSAGLQIPMITGEGSLVDPDDARVKPLLKAMDENDIRLLKLGYFRFDPLKDDYWEKVDKSRRSFSGWEKLAEEYNIKICYHTHSNRCLGLNCAALMHILKGFDPALIGAYMDPCHMIIEGEEFAAGLSMAEEYLSIVALKDVLLEREEVSSHGRKKRKVVPAGTGMVDWSAVFGDLKRINFNGPLSIHCEFEVEEDEFNKVFRDEVLFFKGFKEN